MDDQPKGHDSQKPIQAAAALVRRRSGGTTVEHVEPFMLPVSD